MINLLTQAFSIGTAHAQSWSVASTSALVSGTETSTAASVYAALPIVIPITIGLAVFFFFFGWLLSKAKGKH